jgi:adenylate cyclase
MANVYSNDYWLGTTKSPRDSIDKAIQLVQKALTVDENLAEARGFLVFLYTQNREYEKAIAEGERAVALYPGDATVLYYYAASLHFGGRSEESIPLFKKTIRLNPVGAYFNFLSHQNMGNALMATGRYDEAVSAYKVAMQAAPHFQWPHIQLAATYGMMGRDKEARAEAEEVLRINPKFTMEFWEKTALVKDQMLKNRLRNALLKAGLK